MKYKFTVTNERLKYLVEELKENITIFSADKNFTTVEINITNGSDLLHVFHAGVSAGIAALSYK